METQIKHSEIDRSNMFMIKVFDRDAAMLRNRIFEEVVHTASTLIAKELARGMLRNVRRNTSRPSKVRYLGR